MTINTTLKVKIDGGSPVDSVTVADGSVVQPTALDKSGWVQAWWLVYGYPVGFGAPSGYTSNSDDAVMPSYQAIGKSDPSSFTVSGPGAWTLKLIVQDGTGALIESTEVIVRVDFDNGLHPIGVREQAQFGGAKAGVVTTLNENLLALDGVIGATLTASDVDPTPDTLAKRGPSGEGKFTAVQATSIASTTTSFSAQNSAGNGLTIAVGDVTVATSAGNATLEGQAAFVSSTDTDVTVLATEDLILNAGQACTITSNLTCTIASTSGSVILSGSAGAIDLQRNGVTGATITVHPTGAFSVAPVAGATSVTYQQAQSTVGVGVNAVFAAQRGLAGSIGGVSVLGAPNGGTGGTNLAGGVAHELGQLVGNASAKAAFWCNGTEVAYAKKISATEFGFATAASHDLSLDAATGTLRLKVGAADSVLWTLSASGAVTLAPVGGAASLTIQPAQKTSGAGAPATLAGGQGSSGNVGGKTTVGANNGATPGTNLAGGVDIELGQTVGGVSALASVVANGTTLCTFQQTASARCEISNLALIWLKGASGCLIGSNDDSVRVFCNQSDGFVTAKGTNGGVRLQDTSVTWCEVARVAAGRNVVGLAVGANLDTTKMPANSGNGVVFLANAATAPTASSDSTGTIIYGESSQVRVRETNGFADSLNFIDDSSGGTLKRTIRGLGRATTESTSITTITTIRAAQMPGKGCGIAIVRGFGYDTVTDTVSGYFCRRLVILSVSGALTIVDDDPIGTDALGGGTLTIDVSTDVRIRIQCKDTSNTRWTATVDMHYVEH